MGLRLVLSLDLHFWLAASACFGVYAWTCLMGACVFGPHQERFGVRNSSFAHHFWFIEVRESQGLRVRAAIHTGAPAPKPFYWGSRPKPRRCAKLSRRPTLLSLRGRLMAEEGPGSSDGKVTGRGGISILGFPPQTLALREAIARAQPCFRSATA